MDTALILKQKVDSRKITTFEKALEYLNQSELVSELLADFDMDILNLLNRLTEITEIPFAHQLEQVKIWTSKLAEWSFCGDGFSITGKSDDILSCYNSMITSILIRNNYVDKQKTDKGIEWIMKYQNLQRGIINNWSGMRILKYGGCMKNTPCYIGIVKAMIALTDYIKHPDYRGNDSAEEKLKTGLKYLLDHQVYLRKSSGKPITKDINKLTYPFSYKTNVIEILRLLKHNGLDTDERCASAKYFLRSKKQKDGFWRINSTYLPKCWVLFDKTKEPGLWISYEIERLIGDKPKPSMV